MYFGVGNARNGRDLFKAPDLTVRAYMKRLCYPDFHPIRGGRVVRFGWVGCSFIRRMIRDRRPSGGAIFKALKTVRNREEVVVTRTSSHVANGREG